MPIDTRNEPGKLWRINIWCHRKLYHEIIVCVHCSINTFFVRFRLGWKRKNWTTLSIGYFHQHLAQRFFRGALLGLGHCQDWEKKRHKIWLWFRQFQCIRMIRTWQDTGTWMNDKYNLCYIFLSRPFHDIIGWGGWLIAVAAMVLFTQQNPVDTSQKEVFKCV